MLVNADSDEITNGDSEWVILALSIARNLDSIESLLSVYAIPSPIYSPSSQLLTVPPHIHIEIERSAFLPFPDPTSPPLSSSLLIYSLADALTFVAFPRFSLP